MRSDSLAGRLQNNGPNDFCKEIKRMNNSKTSSPADVDGVIGSEETTQLWQKHHHYEPSSAVMKMSPYKKSFNAVMMLRGNQACGLDKISAETLNLASQKLQYSACIVVEFYLILFYLLGQYLLSKTKLAK